MSSPEKKKKELYSPSLTSLHDDLVLNCLARVSRLYHPTLSLVSKSFRSLLASPELYKTRSLLGRTESCLYVCIETSYGSSPSWFTLCRKPDRTLTKNSSGYVLAKVPILDYPHGYGSNLVAVGSSIYNIKGSRSSNVTIIDCTSHTCCHTDPSFPVKLWSSSVRVLDGKIYVVGCYIYKCFLTNTFQVFDTKTQIWNPMPIPSMEASTDSYFYNSACIDGKFHMKIKGEEVIAYDSKEEGRWDKVGPEMGKHMYSQNTSCVIENVLYSSSSGDLRWYDTKIKMWRNLKGLVGVPKFSLITCVRLDDYGGKMMILWDENSSCGPRKKIWCAEITLEKTSCKSGDTWGKVEWCDHVLSLSSLCFFIKGLVATV